MKLEVGQKIFCAWGNSWRKKENHFSEEIITKVGRKWASFGFREKVDIETGWIDGGQYTSPGKCYLSEEDYRKETALREAWRELSVQLSYLPYPKHITHEKIAKVRELLEISKLKEE
jgi:hypothetical protein